MRIEMELRNVPRFRVMEYLVEAGGKQTDEMGVKGENWAAWLEEMEPARVGTLSVRRDMLIIEGPDEATVSRVHAFMRQKTMRGGG